MKMAFTKWPQFCLDLSDLQYYTIFVLGKMKYVHVSMCVWAKVITGSGNGLLPIWRTKLLQTKLNLQTNQ